MLEYLIKNTKNKNLIDNLSKKRCLSKIIVLEDLAVETTVRRIFACFGIKTKFLVFISKGKTSFTCFFLNKHKFFIFLITFFNFKFSGKILSAFYLSLNNKTILSL